LKPVDQVELTYKKQQRKKNPRDAASLTLNTFQDELKAVELIQ
jgi:hypothetical protein